MLGFAAKWSDHEIFPELGAQLLATRMTFRVIQPLPTIGLVDPLEKRLALSQRIRSATFLLVRNTTEGLLV
jgi:hypothetical protein